MSQAGNRAGAHAVDGASLPCCKRQRGERGENKVQAYKTSHTFTKLVSSLSNDSQNYNLGITSSHNLCAEIRDSSIFPTLILHPCLKTALGYKIEKRQVLSTIPCASVLSNSQQLLCCMLLCTCVSVHLGLDVCLLNEMG